MPKITLIRNNFNGGELSPKIDWRGDLDKYQSGCLTLENMVPLVEGGASRMPGTAFIVETKTSSTVSRVVPFRFSTEQAYDLEFGDLYIRFVKDNVQILDGVTPVEVTTTYAATDIFKLKFTQSADVLYIFHPDYPPAKLSRLSDTSWTLTTINFLPPPTIEDGLEPAATLVPAAVTGLGVNFTASVAVFLTGDVGRTIEYGTSRATIRTFTSTVRVVCDILDDFPSTDTIAAGDWKMALSTLGDMTPSGKKKGEICTLTSDDGSVDLFRAGDLARYVFINGGFIQLTKITSGTVAEGEVLQELSDEASTANWTMEDEKWNATDGYPSAGIFYEQRLVTGGAPGYPQTVNLSVSGDFENFSRDPDLDDAAIEFTLVSNEVEAIYWFANSDNLIIGTIGGLWSLGPSNTSEPIAQTNVATRKLGSIGAKDIEALPVNDTFMWVELSGWILNRLDYSFESDKNISTNMARVAGHITLGASAALSGIVDMAFQKSPQPIIWCVRADGVLLGLTHETQENIYAWFRVVTDGSFESVSVTSNGGEEDTLTCIVNRTIDGSTVRYIEYFKPHEIFGQIDDAYFVHSGVSFDGGDAVDITGITNANPAVVSAVNTFTDGDEIRIQGVEGMTEANLGRTRAWTIDNATGTTFELSGITSEGWGTYTSGGTAQVVKKDFTTGVDHLEGETIDALVDGTVSPQKTVTDGEFSLSIYGNKVHAGLPASSIIEPSKPYVSAGGGTSRGKRQRINQIMLSFYETYSAKVGPDTDNLETIKFGTGSDPELFTGEKELSFKGSWGTDAPLVVQQDIPLPLTLRSIIYWLSVNEE